MSEAFGSAFSIPKNKAEIVFTMYFPLADALDKSSNNMGEKDSLPADGKIIFRPWWKSELSHYVSDGFLTSLQIEHFHITPPSKDVGVQLTGKNFENTAKTIYFVWPKAFYVGEEDAQCNSIAAIECTVFKNGYLALVLRVQNKDKITAEELLDLIRHPELVHLSTNIGTTHTEEANSESLEETVITLNSGDLVIKLYTFAEQLEADIRTAVKRSNIKHLAFESGEWSQLPDFRPIYGKLGERWTRPYVGVFFSLSKTGRELEEDELLRVQRFVIAAGRATPSFLEKFVDPAPYLATGNRNVYGTGGSIVFIGRRGWCVYGAGEHNPGAFRLGVIESTHFVIMALESAARSRRKYTKKIHTIGSPVFRDLNIAVKKMVASNRGLSINPSRLRQQYKAEKNFRTEVSKATEFLARARLVSPCEDVSSLLEAHLTSHTGRAAMLRFRELTRLDQLDQGARDMMANYTAFLKTSADYLRVQTLTLGRATLFVGATVALITFLGIAVF